MRIVVDTNIVFSGILNSSSRIDHILINSKKHFEFFTCNFLEAEISKHQGKLLKLTKLEPYELAELQKLVTANIIFINEQLIPPVEMLRAETLLMDIDINDTPFVALTNYLDCKLWTGDKVLIEGLRDKGYEHTITTSELSQLLSEFEIR
ncbi:hypothetical protein DYBT9623_02279 [Dyadobacter sp. CECT 9623]|uniref:PIN domain-containing protein n=1 Tax=Dyadobacter linearis TaxID=2823330 RepID=A0ABN7RDF0_9BACT|nr:PIN domain-containing protein [Dyadobacter sp. CECT 9623]CAG5069543.1 hypothetical protein DYBT9623_02279 [Dyadobacter sp. CECT 9623]